jgi:NADH dehydrogenase [ubiquinone] 1 alpha subcomplex assembly factor 7
MTPLADLLIRRIMVTGPITLADYMAECLLHPQHGYYSTRDPFGASGDFITAPEISQMFGELLGLSMAQTWLDQGSHAAFTLAELGPGRGTLMADVLRATKGVPGFHAAAKVVLVEASPTLRGVQAQTLAAYSPSWADSIADLPDAPLYVLANEFFDALPIDQFQRDKAGWRQRIVGLQNSQLALGLSDPLPCPDPRFAADPLGTVVEICPSAAPIAAHIGAIIRQHGGAAVIIDYGNWRSKGDTLQALRNHAAEDALASPGQADLTAHVDFEALVLAAGVDMCSDLTDQGPLLQRLGIDARAARLAQGLSGSPLQNHLAATRRLTDPTEMGTLFKAMAICPPHCTLPPGFY